VGADRAAHGSSARPARLAAHDPRAAATVTISADRPSRRNPPSSPKVVHRPKKNSGVARLLQTSFARRASVGVLGWLGAVMLRYLSRSFFVSLLSCRSYFMRSWRVRHPSAEFRLKLFGTRWSSNLERYLRSRACPIKFELERQSAETGAVVRLLCVVLLAD
jgi:hypothetical protein